MADNDLNKDLVRLRRAKANDYDAILDINRNVYEGFDYLSSLFHTFLQHPDIRLYVTEYNGNIVHFIGGWLMENGHTVLSFAGRVRADIQGRGIMGRAMQLFRNEIARITHPNPGLLIYTSYYKSKVHPPLGFLKSKARAHRKWNVFRYVIDSDVLSALDKEPTSSVKRFSMDTTLSLLRYPELLNMIKKDGDYFVNSSLWVPLKVTQRNLVNLAKLASAVQFSIRDQRTVAVTFCHELLNTANSMRSDIYFYGGGKDNGSMLASHVLSYLVHLKATTPTVNKYYIMLHFPTDIDVTSADQHLLPIMGKTYIHDRNGVTAVVVWEFVSSAKL